MEKTFKTSLFDPAPSVVGKSKTKLMATGFSKKVPYYVVPDSATDNDKLIFGVYLMYCGTSKNTSVEVWKTYVLTYAALITPGFAGAFPASSYLKTEINPIVFDGLVNLVRNFDALMEAQNAAEVTRVNNEIVQFATLDLLPRPDATVPLSGSYGEWDIKVLFCHYSIMLYLAGKRVAGVDRTQITVARPRALKGKVHIEANVNFLEGTLRLSNESHIGINNAWSEMGAVRNVVFSEYAKYEDVSTDELQNIIWTTMHLLKYSQMGHSVIVYNFIQAYPWVFELPSLRPSLACYVRSVVSAADHDKKMFPYIKLIKGDKSEIFPRKEMEPLIACAVAGLEETQTTLSAYYVDPAYGAVVDAFMEMKAHREKMYRKKVGLDDSDDSGDSEDEGEEETEDVE